MGVAVDIIIVAIIGACIYSGYRKGLIKCLLKLATSVLAIIVALTLYKPFVNFVVESTLIDDNIQYSIEKTISDDESKKEDNTIDKSEGMPNPVVKYINENLKTTVEEQKEKAITNVSRQVAELIVKLGCIVILYIITKILLRIIIVIFDIFSKLPIIKQFNELGGLLYGIIEGFVLVLLALAIISVIISITGNTFLIDAIESSYIGSMLYNNNILLNLIF